MKRVDYANPATMRASTPSGAIGNIQEITCGNPLKVSTCQAAADDSRPRVLAQRRARQIRRLAH